MRASSRDALAAVLSWVYGAPCLSAPCESRAGTIIIIIITIIIMVSIIIIIIISSSSSSSVN